MAALSLALLASGLAAGGAPAAAASGTTGVASSTAGSVGATAAAPGYSLVASDGGVFSFGSPFYGSAGSVHLNRPVVGMAATPDGRGYYLVASDGGVFAYGDARFQGSTGSIRLNRPIVGMAVDPLTGGYWLVASDGGVFAFDAPFYGSTGSVHLNQPVVGMAPTPDGRGYYLVASDGGVFTFGDARFQGSTGSVRLNKPIVGMAADATTGGYTLVASDGGVFPFDAPFYGSTGSVHLNQPVVGMAPTPDGRGYYLVASDGGVFTFGDAVFEGSTGSIRLNRPIVGIAAALTGAAVPVTGPTVPVTDFGAVGNGVTDDTAAFEAAVAAVQAAGGGTVYVPPGTWAFASPTGSSARASVRIPAGPPVALLGAGQADTRLVEDVPGQILTFVGADGSAVEGLTLDAASHVGGNALAVSANHTLVTQDTILGATKTVPFGSGQSSPFAIYYGGPPGATPLAPAYHVGNVVNDISVSDGVNNDGFSFSFQKDATIENVTHYGSRLALYIDSGVTVRNYVYRPNPVCLGAEDGFWITQPSTDISIQDFVTYGAGGEISPAPSGTLTSSNISVVGEQFMAPGGYHLTVGNVSGLSISGAQFNSANTLYFNPPSAATGVVVTGSTIPMVRFAGTTSSQLGATFVGDTYPAVRVGGRPTATFAGSPPLGPSSVAIEGGVFGNTAGGLIGNGAPPVSVSGLQGYP